MKKLFALLFCIFLAGCASQPSVKSLNLAQSLNFNSKSYLKVLEQGDAAVYSGTLHGGIYIYINDIKPANYLGIAKSEQNAFFSAKELSQNDILIKSVKEFGSAFDASLERTRELKCGVLVVRLKERFDDMEAGVKFLEQIESAFLKMSSEIGCK